MLSQQELSDRAEIQDLIVAEASAMDRRDWARWQECFTPDAAIDYSENDGAVGSPAEVGAWLASVLERFHSYQHLSSNAEIELDGDAQLPSSICDGAFDPGGDFPCPPLLRMDPPE